MPSEAMLNRVKRILCWFVAFVFVAFTSFFAIQNYQSVNIDLLYQQIELPLVFIILTAFLFGLVVAWLLNAWVFIKQINTIRELTKDIQDCKQELSQLRKLPLSRP